MTYLNYRNLTLSKVLLKTLLKITLAMVKKRGPFQHKTVNYKS